MSLESLVRTARALDIIDAFAGPAASLCFYSGSDYLNTLGWAINAIDLAIKIPFIISYISQTKDVASLLYWVPKEVAANTFQFGGFLDIVPTYSLRAEYVIKR